MDLEIDELFDGKWKVEKIFEPSGQGQSAIVTVEGEPESKYVIKLLKDIENSTNLARFEQEIDLLEKLHEVERIPSIVDKNISKHYYVMEFIEGPKLENAIQSKQNKRKFDKSLTAIMQLLDIVNDYSRLKIVHRDIKPANIICKNRDIEDLYLIDFGIGYDCDNSEDLTEANVQLGNKFLRLPELQNGNKRDIRSDITMCVGILFFLLTGSPPVNLLDENQKMPHQTEKGIVNLQWIGSDKLKIINGIFDKGFKNNIEERFQNVRDLIFALNEINKYQVSDKSKRSYARKTDSFCWTTIQKILKSTNVGKEEYIMRKLKVYDGKTIAICDAYFVEIENKRFIHMRKDNLIEAIEHFPNYSCERIDGLFVRNKDTSEEILMKQEDLFEVFAQIHIKDKKVTFDNFILQNALYEIPVTRFLEPFYDYNFLGDIKAVMSHSKNMLFLKKDSYYAFDFYKESMQEMDLSELFQDNVYYKVSENLQWVLCWDGSHIYIAKLEEGKYIKLEKNVIYSLKKEILDYAFWDNDLIILCDNELLIYDLENDKCKEEYNIKKENYALGRVDRISYVSSQSGLVILENRRGKKLYYNLKSRKGIKEGLGEKSQYISSLDMKFLYKRNYKGIIKDSLEDLSSEIICDAFNDLTPYRGIENLERIEMMLHDYYFCLINDEENRWKSKKVVRVYKFIDGKQVKICDISDKENIADFWIFPKGIITINESNTMRCWKIYT